MKPWRVCLIAIALLLAGFGWRTLRRLDARHKAEEAHVQLEKMSEAAFAYFNEDHIDRGATVGFAGGATPGGSQDIGFARRKAQLGELARPDALTSEGLFSEHDLPLSEGGPCRRTLCMAAEATTVDLLVQPEITHLAQIGLSSGPLERRPRDIVAVVDGSGSMQSSRAIVREALQALTSSLGPRDRLGVVVFSEEARVRLEPTRHGFLSRMATVTATEHFHGSTNLQAGLRAGYALAREARRASGAEARVVLLTDERPNAGSTGPRSFMTMAQQAAREGIGTTTIGVSSHFDPELAKAIADVPGGNLFYVGNAERARELLGERTDEVFTEIARDMEIVVTAEVGYSIRGLYGVPGHAVQWLDDGALQISIPSVFVSRNKGGIFVGIAGERDAARRGTLATVDLRFTEVGGERRGDTISVATRPLDEVGEGLRRGRWLVDEITALREASTLYWDARAPAAALEVIGALASRIHDVEDPDLLTEVEMICRLEAALAKTIGRRGASQCGTPVLDVVSGLPVARAALERDVGRQPEPSMRLSTRRGSGPPLRVSPPGRPARVSIEPSCDVIGLLEDIVRRADAFVFPPVLASLGALALALGAALGWLLRRWRP